MTTACDTSTHRRAAEPRARRWLFLYFLLAAFDLMTVSFSLYLNHRITRSYLRSVTVNREWADRQGIYADLGRLAAKVNAPGNDVFATMNMEQERARLLEAAAALSIRIVEARRELSSEIEQADAAPLLALLTNIQATMSSVAADAEQVFVSLSRSDAHEAAEVGEHAEATNPTSNPSPATLAEPNEREAAKHMSTMNHTFQQALAFLNELNARVRFIQQRRLDEQASAANSIRSFELVIAGLIVLMVGGVSIYGVYLIRQSQRAVRQRELFLRAIEASEARLTAVFRTATEGILTVRDGRWIESANPAAGSIFACAPESLIGRDAASLLENSDHPLATPCSGVEIVARRDTGVAFPLELAVSEEVELPDGRLSTWIVRDISDRKQIEAELAHHREHLERLVEERTSELEASYEQLRIAERLASIGTLAAGLGHDMKNLLFPMRCRLDALDRLALPNKAKNELHEVRSSLNYLQQLSGGLRLLSLDPQDAGAAPAWTNLNQWWSEVGGFLTRSLPKSAQFKADLPDDLPPIPAPAHQLTQAILNLIVNAGEAIEDTGTITLHAESIRGGAAVQIGVSDTGCGMTGAVRRQALDPFFTTKKRGLSTGLGLSLVHAVATSAGGELRIDSQPGQGATIVLTFPTRRERSDEKAESGAEEGELNRALQAVVSIEDPRVASFISAALALDGAQVVRSRTRNGAPSPALWVTETNSVHLAEVRRFLAEDRRNRVVAIGDDRDQRWRELGAQVIGRSVGAATLRASILEAIQSFRRSIA